MSDNKNKDECSVASSLRRSTSEITTLVPEKNTIKRQRLFSPTWSYTFRPNASDTPMIEKMIAPIILAVAVPLFLVVAIPAVAIGFLVSLCKCVLFLVFRTV